MPEFKELPPELRVEIFKKLDPISLNIASSACKDWRKIITGFFDIQNLQKLLKQKYAEQTTDPASQHNSHIVTLHLMGDCDTGKTSFVIRYCEGKFPQPAKDDIMPDGFHERQYSIDGDTSSSYYYQVHGSKVVQTNEGRVAVKIYNDALLEDHQRKWRPETRYNRTYDIILVFFDITNRRSFESLKDNIKYEKRWDMRENLFFIIIGTKADLSYKRVISKEKAEQFARNLGFPYMETSALTGENVEETFALAVEIALTAKLHDISMSEAARWLQNIRFEIKPDEPQPETNTTSKCLVM